MRGKAATLPFGIGMGHERTIDLYAGLTQRMSNEIAQELGMRECPHPNARHA